MNREERFLSYRDHAFLHKIYAKLKPAERDLALIFLREHAALDRSAFEYKLNRYFLDREKPKNWGIILELLCNANTADSGDL